MGLLSSSGCVVVQGDRVDCKKKPLKNIRFFAWQMAKVCNGVKSCVTSVSIVLMLCLLR